MTTEVATIIIDNQNSMIDYLDKIDVFVFILIIVLFMIFMLRKVKIC